MSTTKPLPEDYEVEGTRIPIRSWVPNDLDDKTFEQASNLAKLPFTINHVALMPDAHAGYGMPIGGVLFADKAVVPYAIGVDIGCGVQIAKTNLVWGDTFDKEKLKNVLHQIQRDVPTGFSVHKDGGPYTLAELEERLLARGASYYEAVELAEAEGFGGYEHAFAGALAQVGTLGGGNHFLEVQRDDDNVVYFMLHSGSRSLGKKTCDFYAKHALAQNQRYHVALPDKDLAFFPADTSGFRAYWSAMEVGLRWAEINREWMMSKVEYAFKKHASVHSFDVLTDVHHNYASWENHLGRNGVVHRKGAVSAREGEMVLIPGSMGTNSYIAEGLGNKLSFTTCQHGAGRAVGRKEMMRRMTTEEVMEDMKNRDVMFISNEPKSAAEEAPSAYKDISDVIEASKDLIKPLVKLTPLGVVKG